MLFMVEATFPGTAVKETTSRFLKRFETDPVPDYVRLIELYAHGGGDGYRTLMFWEFDDGKEKDGVRYVSGGMVDLLNNIEGYKTESHVVYNMATALEFLGVQAPAL